MKTLAVVNHKGGVGKTTLTVVLLHLLAEQGLKVLAVDLDPQANLTLCLTQNISEDIPQSYHLLIKGSSQPISLGNIDLIPSSLLLSQAEFELVSMHARELRLKRALSTFNSYDLILVDTPPNLGILTINALIASDGVLIPVETQFFSLSGLKHIFRVLQELEEYTGIKTQVVALAPTFYEKHVALHNKVLEELQKLPYKVLPPIPKRAGFQYASINRGDLKQLDQETLKILSTYAEEVIKWLRGT
jgi:chromosome partitioning protein